ncbi:MAG: hypothetical protein ACRECH_11065 [Nitrososphaerales archaeon]
MSGFRKQIIFTAALMAVVVLGIGLGTYYLQPRLLGVQGSQTTGTFSASTTSKLSLTSVSALSSGSSTLTFSGCNKTMDINGTQYCMLDVTDETVLVDPGYTVFKKAITYNGVTFATLCPSGYYGCPNVLNNETTETLLAGVINLNITFPDNTNELTGNILLQDGGQNLTVLSNQVNPRAGVFIESVPSGYSTFLLVQENA